MRLDLFLNENRLIDYDKSIEIIKRNCNKTLIWMRNNDILFRRILPRKVNQFHYGIEALKSPRKDRKPKDTPLAIHEIFDEYFQKKFGWKARSEGLFTYITSLFSYKSVYTDDSAFIIPFNDFKFIWSKEIIDLYGGLDQIKVSSYDDLSDVAYMYKTKRISDDKLKEIIERNNVKEKIFKFLDINGNYTDKDISRYSSSEVMIKCRKYCVITRKRKNHEMIKNLAMEV